MNATDWAVPISVGLRYDQLARRPGQNWWRVVLGSLLIVLGTVAAMGVFSMVGDLIAPAFGVQVLGDTDSFADKYDNPVFTFAVVMAGLAAALPVVFGVTIWIQQRRVGTLSSVAGKLRWFLLLKCFGVAVLATVARNIIDVMVFSATGEPLSSDDWIGWDALWPTLLVIGLLVPFQAAAEEYVFRGWLLQAFGTFIRNRWPGIVLGACIFTSLHAFADWGIIAIFAFGVLTGWLAIRTGGLEAPIALHMTLNFGAFGLSAATGELSDVLWQKEIPWQLLPGTAVQFTLFTWLVLILVRRHKIAARSAASDPHSRCDVEADL